MRLVLFIFVLKNLVCFGAFAAKFGINCENSYTLFCFKLDLANWIDNLHDKINISVLPGVSIVKENISAPINTTNIVAELGREFPNDPNARLDAYLWRKIKGFVSSHSVKFTFDLEEGEHGETARKKRKNGMGMLLAIGGLIKSTLFTLGIGTLAAVAGKAMMTSLISLLISTLVGIKSLSGGGGKGGDVHRFDLQERYLEPMGLNPEYKPV